MNSFLPESIVNIWFRTAASVLLLFFIFLRFIKMLKGGKDKHLPFNQRIVIRAIFLGLNIIFIILNMIFSLLYFNKQKIDYLLLIPIVATISQLIFMFYEFRRRIPLLWVYKLYWISELSINTTLFILDFLCQSCKYVPKIPLIRRCKQKRKEI